jgi:hypothetical protein
MLHEEILQRYFTINRNPQDWIALDTLDGTQLPGFKTRRIAKSETGETLYFTIGETEKGKTAGLDRTIEGIIQTSGLEVLSLQSTDGNRPDKVYPGFDLRVIDADQLDAILRRVQTNIDSLN